MYQRIYAAQLDLWLSLANNKQRYKNAIWLLSMGKMRRR